MRKWTRTTACAVAVTAAAALATGCSASSSAGSASTVASLTSAMPTNYGPAEETTLNVGIVPAMDSAGFFVALHNGLFAKEGLKINYQPATSSDTAISQQTSGALDITAGNYVSYIQYEAISGSTPLEVVAEGSVMQAGAQTIFVRPGSKIKTLAELKGATVATNAPLNVDYLLAASVLQENNVSPASVHWTTYASAFPTMAASLNAGKWDAMVVPEPFATIAEQEFGEVPLADLNQGATADFPVEGYVVTKAWAKANPNTLKRFLAALEVGQEISDTDRGAVETAFETLASPPDGQVSPEIGAVMALDTYPIGVDKVRLQRVADVMHQFGLLPNAYNVSSMLMPSSAFNFSQFSSSS